MIQLLVNEYLKILEYISIFENEFWLGVTHFPNECLERLETCFGLYTLLHNNNINTHFFTYNINNEYKI